MGWKSTINITREKALELIFRRLSSDITNDELSNVLESCGYGEIPDLKYYGHNFWVTDEIISR